MFESHATGCGHPFPLPNEDQDPKRTPREAKLAPSWLQLGCLGSALALLRPHLVHLGANWGQSPIKPGQNPIEPGQSPTEPGQSLNEPGQSPIELGQAPLEPG